MIDCKSKVAAGRESRWDRKPYTPDSPLTISTSNEMYEVEREDVPSSESLTEVDKLSRSLEIVSVLALLGSGSSTVQLDVGDQSSVGDFLGTHELDELDIVLGDTGLGEFLDRESVGTVVEEVTTGQPRS